MRNASALISSASKRASFHPTHAPPTPTSHNLPISTTQNKIHIPNCPPANMANPCSCSDVATIPSLATLSAAVVQRPLVALKMSTALLKTNAAQRISVHLQRLKARLLPPNTRPPTPTSHNLPISTTQNKNHKLVSPPANMANPCSGSDVAASAPLATLRAAVVQRPLVASKMSTALLTTLITTPPPPAQRISAHLQRLKARILPPNTRPPPTPTSHNLPISTTQNNNHKPVPPPANMANPCSGSDVAAR
jgi:hypothetical protein